MAVDRAIISLAILKVNWDRKKEDYIENFVPFIATLINIKKYLEIKPETIVGDFQREFGITIPLQPISTILSRCVKREIIKRNDRYSFVPNWEKVARYDFADRKIEQEIRQNKIVSELQTFVSEKFKDNITKEEIQDVLIEYFKQHDIDILFAAYQQSLLPDSKPDKKKRYYLYRFIQYCSGSDPAVFSYIVDLAIGHALMNAIVYENDYRNYQGKLMNLTVYLDIHFLLRLSGVEGEPMRENVLNFIEGIKQKGGKVKIFQHTHDEALGILNGTKMWINKRGYDATRANIATKYFVENSKTESDVDICISQLDTLLYKEEIAVETAPDRSELKKYLISEVELQEKLVAIYEQSNPNFDREWKENTIYKDISSISAIYILRKNEKPRTIKSARYIFITINSSLAHAARIFEQTNYPDRFVIPACLTEMFFGTAIWLDNAIQMTKFSKLNLISNCLAALNPSRELTKRYLFEIEKMNKTGNISDDQYYYMKADKYVFELLESKTFGIEENFSDRTAHEILQETILSEKSQSEKKLAEQIEKDDQLLSVERSQHQKSKDELKEERDEKNRILLRSDSIARVVGKLISFLFLAFAIALIILGFLAEPFKIFKSERLAAWFFVPGAIFAALHLITGHDIVGSKIRVQKWIYSTVKGILIGKS